MAMAANDPLVAIRRHLTSGAWLQAECTAREALAAVPDDVRFALMLGIAVAAMGEADRAAPVLEEVARRRQNGPHPCLDLVAMTPPLPRGLIRRQFQACLRLSPSDRKLRLAFVEFLLDNDLAKDAEAVLAPALNDAASFHLMGLVRAEQGHFHSAISAFSRAVVLDPTAAPSWSNLGMVLKIEDCFEEAMEAHDHALALAPNNARFRVNRAVTLLKAGMWEQAWQDYEWRLRLDGELPGSLTWLLPSMADQADMTGLTVVALHEEGFGDTLQFLRYLPMLAERGAKVVACVPQPLVRLMALVPGVAQVISDVGSLPAYDFICPFFSLPRAFGTNVRTIPPAPRLIPDHDLRREWLARLPRDGMLVGLVWAGQSRPWLPGFRTLDSRRSMNLAMLAPLAAVPGVRFVSLQMGPAARQKPPPGLDLIDPMASVADFADTAAIIESLDVVISVDTSVVHLAGLLGKRVFLLDRYDGCWRWLSGRGDSPWCPNLTIFRQEQPGDWSVPIARVAASLEATALFHGSALARTISGGMRERASVG
jgi:Flp pilus assembly protein TadD